MTFLAHINALPGDAVMACLLGVTKFRSQESFRRAFERIDEATLAQWID